MSIRDEVDKTILDFRMDVLNDPSIFEKRSLTLLKSLERLEIRYRDKNPLATNIEKKLFNFVDFVEKDLDKNYVRKLDIKETGIADLLHESNVRLREGTIRRWRESLEEKTKELFLKNPEIKKMYDSSDFFRLKKESLKEKVSRKVLFCIETINKDPSIIGEDLVEWQKPSEVLKNLKEDQINGSINLLSSWGLDREAVSKYIPEIESSIEFLKKTKKVAVGAAIVGGAILTYKLATKDGSKPKNYTQNNQYKIPNYSYLINDGYGTTVPINKINELDLGLIPRTEIRYAIPYSVESANELGFLYYLQGVSDSKYIDLNCLNNSYVENLELGFAQSLGLGKDANKIAGSIKGSNAELYLYNHKNIKNIRDFSGKINNRILKNQYTLDLVHTGPRGGKYRINRLGRKVYDVPKI